MVPKSSPNVAPSGPTGVLSSSRPGVRPGGKRTLGGSKGLTGSPMKKSMGKR